MIDSLSTARSAELDKLLEAYVSNHYSDGVCATYALPDPKFPTPAPIPASVPVPVEEVPAKDVAAEEPKPEADDDESEAKMNAEEGMEEPKEDVVPEKAQEEELAAPESKVPVAKSRIFGLYLVGNKYNPSNYW